MNKWWLYKEKIGVINFDIYRKWSNTFSFYVAIKKCTGNEKKCHVQASWKNFLFFFGHFEETDGSIMDIISKLIHSEREKG